MLDFILEVVAPLLDLLDSITSLFKEHKERKS